MKKLAWESQQSFTLMHELGHLLLHKTSSIDDECDLQSHQGQERDANAFAGHLLVPDSFLASIRDAEQRFVCSLSHRERVGVRETGMASLIIGGNIIAMHVRLSEMLSVQLNRVGHRCVVASRRVNSAPPKTQSTPARLLQQLHTASVRLASATCPPAHAARRQVAIP